MTVLASQITMRGNVIFNKIDDVAMTTAKWRVTLVTELRPYDDLLANTLNYITQIENISKHTVQAHYIGRESELDVYFSVLRTELKFINKTREEIFKKCININY